MTTSETQARPGALAEALDGALAVIDENMVTFGTRYPGDTTTNGRYRSEARAMVESLARDHAGGGDTGSNAQLLQGVYDWRSGKGVNEGNLWGDYSYLEALLRLQRPDWTPYW